MTDWTNKTVDELRLLYYGPTCADVAGVDLFDELARRAQANDAMRATLSNWCVQFGAALCPTAGSADSFGDGMRAAKKQVSRILAAAPTAASSGAPAPADSQREAAIEAWRKSATDTKAWLHLGSVRHILDDVFEVHADTIDEAVALMRSAAPAPVAPVTDAEIDAAIADYRRHVRTVAFIETSDEEPINEEAQELHSCSALRSLIARRVEEARGAGLRELRARLVDFCRIRDRGYDVRSDFSPLWVLDEIDRLLAAPPASKLAEEPAQEDDGPCLSALLANMRMEMSDGANGMRTPREEAIAAVVECVARRIEALENNKEAGK